MIFSQSIIDIQDVSFSYEDNIVFKDVNISIPKNEIWALLGKSGVGKTTLLNIIAGIFKPIQGNVLIDGVDAYPGKIKGIVFQDDSLLGWLTIKENLLFPNNSRKNKNNLKEELLKEVGLKNCTDKYPYEMSAGMKKRLEFARALSIDNKYILVDEPFGTVDAVTRRKLWMLWLKLRDEEPRTGILCTHDPEEAIRLCDVIVTMVSDPIGRIGDIIRIPNKIKSLKISEEIEDFWHFKKKIILSLEGNQGG